MVPQEARPQREDKIGRRWWPTLLLVVIVAGVLVIGHSPLRPKPFSDGYFHEEAKGLKAAILRGDIRLCVPIIHSPGVPFYYLPAYLIVPAGASEQAYWYAAVSWNAGMLWAAALLMGSAAALLGGERARALAWAAVPASFFPMYYSAGVASETPAFLGAAATVWAGVRLFARGQSEPLPWGLAAGACLGWLVSMRGNYVLTIPLIAASGLAGSRWKVRAGALLAGATGALISMLVFAGVAELNRAMGAAARQDAFLTHVLIQGAFQYRTEPLDWRPWEEETRSGSRDYAAYAQVRRELASRRADSGLPMSEVEWAWLREDVKANPWAWFRMALFKAASALWFRISPARVERVLGEGAAAGLAAFLISAVLNAPFLAALILAAKLAVCRPLSVQQLLVCWAPFVGGLIFVASTYSEPRYLVPGFAGVLVLAAVSLSFHFDRSSKQPLAAGLHFR